MFWMNQGEIVQQNILRLEVMKLKRFSLKIELEEEFEELSNEKT